jgi:membrane protein DedA with SNARE-associated domain
MMTYSIGLIVHFVLFVIQSLGYGGVFVLMALESANIPIPSEVVMPFSGFLAWQGSFSFWWVVVWGTLGNVAGSLISYYGAEWAITWRDRSAMMRHLISERSLRVAHRWFDRWGDVSVFFARLLPVVRTFISFPAGMGKMRVWPFILFTAVGSFVWSLLLTWIGYALGTRWDALSPYFHVIDAVIVVAGVAAFVWWIAARRARRAALPGDHPRV